MESGTGSWVVWSRTSSLPTPNGEREFFGGYLPNPSSLTSSQSFSNAFRISTGRWRADGIKIVIYVERREAWLSREAAVIRCTRKLSRCWSFVQVVGHYQIYIYYYFRRFGIYEWPKFADPSLTLASNLKQGNSCWSSTLSMISQVHSLSLNGHMLLQDLKHQRTFWPAHPFSVCKRSHRTWSWKWSSTWKHQFRKNKLVVEWYRHALMCVDYYYFDQAHVSVTASAHTIGYNWNHDLHRRWLENHTEARLKLRRSRSV